MCPRSEHDPPFNVPKGLDVISKRRLGGTLLLKFYELNREDFLAVMTIRYFEVLADPDPGALKDTNKGFNSFCDLMTEYFLAAPSETMVSAKDEKGQYVNFFGEAIVDHLEDPANPTSQQLYAYDGSQKRSQAWKLVNAFVRYVAIDCFNRALSWQQEIDILKARARIKELQERRRKLECVPKPGGSIFN
jgi:hypothetical protein